MWLTDAALVFPPALFPPPMIVSAKGAPGEGLPCGACLATLQPPPAPCKYRIRGQRIAGVPDRERDLAQGPGWGAPIIMRSTSGGWAACGGVPGC